LTSFGIDVTLEEMKEAQFFERRDDRSVRCGLCRHRCLVPEAKRGICHVRENREGTLYSLVYGRPISVNLDPIEKKPLFHFLPGTDSLSIATVGCNFHCEFCQNCEISQVGEDDRIPGSPMSAERVVEIARHYGVPSISHTYTEPTIFYEYAYDIGKLSDEHGIKNAFVTNGYITEEALRHIRPYLHAMNVDLKGWNEEFYRNVVGAKLGEVLDSLKLIKKLGIWLEVTTLIVPDYSDSDDQFREIAAFIRDELGAGTPWHISRFYPHHKLLHAQPTPVERLVRAMEIGRDAGLKYVYLGNVPGRGGEGTACPKCGTELLKRLSFTVSENRMAPGGTCSNCGEKIEGVWA
jgi:pyruvate formate lyase activating enzyme